MNESVGQMQKKWFRSNDIFEWNFASNSNFLLGDHARNKRNIQLTVRTTGAWLPSTVRGPRTTRSPLGRCWCWLRRNYYSPDDLFINNNASLQLRATSTIRKAGQVSMERWICSCAKEDLQELLQNLVPAFDNYSHTRNSPGVRDPGTFM